MDLLIKNDVAIYCSRPSKAEIPLEEQLERLKKYCNHFGLNIVKEYIDTDNFNKPLFNQMVEDIKSKEFNIVLSYSLDTLTKNDDELYKVVNELCKYKYELQLESSYIYDTVMKPLIKRERNENIQEENKDEKKKKAKCYPMFKAYKVKNPKSKTPYNWVDLLGEDTSWFEENPIFDNKGNYLGTGRDVFVIMKDIVGFGRIKMSEEEKQEKARKEENISFKPRKLFETHSDIVEREEKENEQRQIKSCDIL